MYLGGVRGPGTSILPYHILSLFIFPLSHPCETELEALWEYASVFSKGIVHFWMLTNKLFLEVSVCCMDLLSTLFLRGPLQPLEMGSIHPVLSGFTEIGRGAKMCLASRHLGICDKKGCS